MSAIKRTSTRDLTVLKMFLMKWTSIFLKIKNGCPISSVAVETTQHCNRRCTYCPVSIDPKPRKAMKFEIFQEIIDQLALIGFRGYLTYHFFNEPLLNRDLEKLVNYASHHLPKARHVIFTNGDLLTSERASSLLASGVTLFIVTNHGGRQLTEFVERVERAWWIFHPRIWFRRLTNESSLFNRGGLVEVVLQRRFSYCSYLAYEMVIDVDGNVVLCCNDYYGSTQFGNVMRTPILNIWHSASMSNLRNRLLKGEFDLPICRRCSGVTETVDLVTLTRKPSVLERANVPGGGLRNEDDRRPRELVAAWKRGAEN
ncbi:MAG: SPASM domain-containing protein [Acidobacteriota bacterium]|nr:SPASM domain-containing protein [Acidobacteriota bacterium]